MLDISEKDKKRIIREMVQEGYGITRIALRLKCCIEYLKKFSDQHGISLQGHLRNVRLGTFLQTARTGLYTADDLASTFELTVEQAVLICNSNGVEINREPEPPQPAQATAILPGPAKVEILRQRVERGEPLWHPNDADYEGWRGGA